MLGHANHIAKVCEYCSQVYLQVAMYTYIIVHNTCLSRYNYIEKYLC